MDLLGRLDDDYDEVGEVRGKGLMIAIEYVEAGGRQPDPALASRVLDEARRRGLLVGRGGRYGNCLRISPPMTVTADEIAEAAGILAEATRAAVGRLSGVTG
jgi:4-aminobutyrate aminotransferase